MPAPSFSFLVISLSPGIFVRSVFPSDSGEPIFRLGSEIVDDQTPFGHRWGGWYVTGYQGSENHRGNAFGSDAGAQAEFSPVSGRPADLSEYFDPSRYLRATSDVVALLVFEHQLTMQNSLTHAAFSCRKMLDYQRALEKSMGDPATDEPHYDSVKSVFAGAVQNVVDHLLFRGAAVLPDGVLGNEEFRHRFPQDAPRTRSGHSLKELRLKDRLFAYRCSYLIYSESFAVLPPQLRDRILDRLQAALTDPDPQGRYAYLPAAEKQQIHEILLETLPLAQARWRQKVPGNATTSSGP